MYTWATNAALSCWKPFKRFARIGDRNDESTLTDKNLWHWDLEKHSCGEFSTAVVRANEDMEDQSIVRSGGEATFVGVYDGHGGNDASKFACDHLFQNLMTSARERGSLSEDALLNAFAATEEGFFTVVRRSHEIRPLIQAIGSCCLVGLICRGTLYVANLGDSRAVIGTSRKFRVEAVKLTQDHNASQEEVRRDLMRSHPDDPNIVFTKDGTWRVKGIIQITRSIGDAYLKKPQYALGSSFPKFHLTEPLRRPVISAVPDITTRVLKPQDKFIIFASDGLWDHLENQEAVNIAKQKPRAGVARRLLRAALTKAALKHRMTYEQLKSCPRRRDYHDDISVVVIFLDHDNITERNRSADLSIRSYAVATEPSGFNFLQSV